MSVPEFQNFLLPILKIAANGEVLFQDAISQVSDFFNLSEDDRNERTKSGITKVKNRVSWAITYLTRAGLTKRTRRAYFDITDSGKKVLAENPTHIDYNYLSHFEAFVEYKFGRQTAIKNGSLTVLENNDTPQDRIDSAIDEMNQEIVSELLEKIIALPPKSFEKLIINLMEKMGYGDEEDSQHTGNTSDGGVDGIIYEDKLGLGQIYLQAKRYSVDKVISVDKIREFAGTMSERGATKGVFVTTSRFTKDALAYNPGNLAKLVRIDGDKLTNLMLKYGVGVRTINTIELKKVDSDYFDELII
ncbi:MAG: restriction endonuclease [Candidatus Symbiobacter sp.]|nr:restriction endonuclease [Candidatus Symbiobacter sp.]